MAVLYYPLITVRMKSTRSVSTGLSEFVIARRDVVRSILIGEKESESLFPVTVKFGLFGSR